MSRKQLDLKCSSCDQRIRPEPWWKVDSELQRGWMFFHSFISVCSLVPSLLDVLVGRLPLPEGTTSAAQRRGSGARASPARGPPGAEATAEPYSYLEDLRAASAAGAPPAATLRRSRRPRRIADVDVRSSDHACKEMWILCTMPVTP